MKALLVDVAALLATRVEDGAAISIGDARELLGRVRAAYLAAPEQSRSQKLRDAGYTARPLALPPEDEPEQSELQDAKDTIELLEMRIDQLEATEPVGYVYSDLSGSKAVKNAAVNANIPNGTPLYTAAPQPTPPEPVNQMLLAALRAAIDCLNSPHHADLRLVLRDSYAAIAAVEQAPQPTELTDEQLVNAMCADGCERIESFYLVGPVQKAAVWSFARAIERAVLAAQRSK